MKNLAFILTTFVALVVFSSDVCAQNRSKTPLSKIDLLKIQNWGPANRFQDADRDIPSHAATRKIADEMLLNGTAVIPFLISKLDDRRKLKETVVDFWSGMTVDELAFVILTHLVTDTNRKSSIPGFTFDEFLGRTNRDKSSVNLYYDFVNKYGRDEIKKRWQTMWNENKSRLYWDRKDRVFRLR